MPDMEGNELMVIFRVLSGIVLCGTLNAGPNQPIKPRPTSLRFMGAAYGQR